MDRCGSAHPPPVPRGPVRSVGNVALTTELGVSALARERVLACSVETYGTS